MTSIGLICDAAIFAVCCCCRCRCCCCEEKENANHCCREIFRAPTWKKLFLSMIRLEFVDVHKAIVAHIDCWPSCRRLFINLEAGCVWADEQGYLVRIGFRQCKPVSFIRGLDLFQSLEHLAIDTSHMSNVVPVVHWPRWHETMRNLKSLWLERELLPRTMYKNLFHPPLSNVSTRRPAYWDKEWVADDSPPMLAQLRMHCWLKRGLLETCIALAPLALPSYILLWICDYLPSVAEISELKKIKRIEGIVATRRRLLAARNENNRQRKGKKLKKT